jgi:hypothetical protein
MRFRDLTCTGVGLWILLYAAALGLPTRAHGEGLEPVTVELGKHRLAVPGYNAQLIRRTPGLERGLSGLDKESGVLLSSFQMRLFGVGSRRIGFQSDVPEVSKKR